MEQEVMTNDTVMKTMTTGVRASREYAIERTNELRKRLDSFCVGEVVGLDETPIISFADERSCAENIDARNKVRPKGFTKGKRTGRVVQVTPNFVTVEMIKLPKTLVDTPKEAWCESFGLTDLGYLYRVEG